MAGQNMSVQILIGAAVASSLGSAFTSAANQVSSLQRQIKRMDDGTKSAVQAQMGLMKAFNQGTVSADTYAKAMKRLHAQIQFNKTTKGLMQGIAQDRQEFSKLDQQAAIYMGRMMAWGATTKFLAGPMQSAMQFESVMADVRKVVDFDTPQQFKEMGNDILKLSQEIPVSAAGLAQIMASAGQAGIARNELLAFTKDAAKMGVAFDVTADQAGDMMAKWRTAFKMNQTEVVDLADKVNYLGNKTAATAPMIADVVTRIGPLGSVGGVASGEIAAMGASIVGSGIASEVAATGIKNLILGLTAGTSATKKQRAAFAELGLDSTAVAESMQKDAKGTIMSVLESISKLDKASQAAVLKNLFGKESIGAIAPLLSNLQNLKRNMDLVSKPGYEGSMEKEYEERAKTTANAVQLLKNALSSLAVTVGSTLLPYLAQGAAVIATVAKAVANWGKEHPALVKGIYGMVIGFSGFMTVGMGAMMVITRIKQAFTGVIMVIKGLRVAFAALRAAMMLASAHPLVLGLMALIAVGYLVYTHWGQISAFFARMWEGGKAALANFTAWIQAKFDAAYAAVMGAWHAVQAFFAGMWEGAKSAVANFVAYIISKLSEAYDWVMDKWNTITDFLSHPITGTVNIVKNFVGGGGNDTSGVMPPGLAVGGIFNQGAFLTSFAEDSPEAAIPIDGSPRARRLWAETGRRLGMMPISRSGGGPVTVQYSPIVTISGSASKNDLETVMQMSQDRLKRMLRDLQADQRRLAYD